MKRRPTVVKKPEQTVAVRTPRAFLPRWPADYSTLTEWPRGGVVGIHGPYFEPQLIPGRITHGCIRLRVPDDQWLGQHLRFGTPLDVV